MVKGIKILEKLGKENFCKWLRKNGHKLCINLENANLHEGLIFEGLILARLIFEGLTLIFHVSHYGVVVWI